MAAVHAPPKVEEGEIEILSADQIGDVLASRRPHALPIVSLALATGMRRGELLGLQWGDIDLDGGTLRVERSVEETKAGLRLKPPKTKRGRRNITLPSDTVTMLRAVKVNMMEVRLVLGRGTSRLRRSYSAPLTAVAPPRNVSKAWWRAREAMKLPVVSFHAFRHSHANADPRWRGRAHNQPPPRPRPGKHYPRRLRPLV